MIKINQDNMTVEFTPRPGFSKTKPLPCKLIFAHICPSCNNVIQAFFETPSEINLWEFEETRQMSIDPDGIKTPELRHLVPGPKDIKGKTQYNSYFDFKTKSQKIVLKNHVLKTTTINLKNSEEKADWEPGGKMCELSGLFSLREDLLIRDYILFSRINEKYLYKFSAKTLDQMKFQPNMKVCGFPVPAIGDAPSIILIRYNIINRGYENSIERFLGHTKIT